MCYNYGTEGYTVKSQNRSFNEALIGQAGKKTALWAVICPVSRHYCMADRPVMGFGGDSKTR